MNPIIGRAVAGGALAGLATWLFMGPWAPAGIQVWAVLIGWVSVLASGHGLAALKSAFVGNVWGAAVATVALVVISLAGGGAAWVALIVAVTLAAGLAAGAYVTLLGNQTATLLAYAATIGYAQIRGLDAASFALGAGPFTTIALSMAIGAVLGWLAELVGFAVGR